MNYILRQIVTKTKDKRLILSFCHGVAWGVLCYLYIFVNNLFNCDNIVYEPSGYGAGIISGRWGLDLLAKISDTFWGNYNIPFFNGLISVFMLAVASYVIVVIFEIKNERFCALIGALTVVFPAISSGMAYTFTIGYYSFAILLTVVGVYLLNSKGIYTFIAGAFLLLFSIGIYQAYFSFGASLLLILLIKMCIHNEFKSKDVILKAGKFLLALILSYLVYFVILNIGLKVMNLSLTEYQGISSMGKFHFIHLLEGILKSYRITLALPLIDYACITTTRVVKISLLVLYSITLLIISIFIKKSWGNQKLKILLLIMFLLAFPIAINLILITSPCACVYTLMCMSFISLFYLPIVLIETTDILDDIKLKFRNLNLFKILSSVATVVLFATVLNYTWQSNGNFRSLYFIDRRLVNYYSEMYTKIRSTTGFSVDKKIVFVGRNIDDPTFTLKTGETPFNYGGVQNIVLNEYLDSRMKTIKNYLGYSYNEIATNSKEYSAYKNQILSMKKYPNDNSIKVIDDVILVRFE